MVGESPGEPSGGGFLALGVYKSCAMPREEWGGGGELRRKREVGAHPFSSRSIRTEWTRFGERWLGGRSTFYSSHLHPTSVIDPAAGFETARYDPGMVTNYKNLFTLLDPNPGWKAARAAAWKFSPGWTGK